MWEGGCRVPAFLSGPSVNATGVSDAMVMIVVAMTLTMKPQKTNFVHIWALCCTYFSPKMRKSLNSGFDFRYEYLCPVTMVTNYSEMVFI